MLRTHAELSEIPAGSDQELGLVGGELTAGGDASQDEADGAVQVGLVQLHRLGEIRGGVGVLGARDVRKVHGHGLEIHRVQLRASELDQVVAVFFDECE